jgi:hypothetical protein
MRTYTVVIPANSERITNTTGNYFTVLSASAAFNVGLGDDTPTPFEEGLGIQFEGGQTFRKVRLINPSGASVTVSFNVGFGKFSDNRVVISGGVSFTRSTDLEAFMDVTIASLTGGALALANSARRELIVCNPITSLLPIRVGRTGGVGAAYGALILPGGTGVIETSARVDCYNPNSAAVAVAVLGIID